MTEEFETLQNLRIEISQGFLEAKILFQKIYEYEENCEIMTIAEIGKKICAETGKNCEKLEIAIEKVKNDLQQFLQNPN